jgi:hypothetical protein
MFWNGDPNVYQLAHVYNQPALLLITLFLIGAGIWLIVRRYRADPWWRFVIYGALVSVVPASLTIEYFHMLRLSALPVFLLLITVPALSWILERRRLALIVGIILLTLIQGIWFQVQYHRSAHDAWRRHVLDADYEEKIFKLALSQPQRPIYLADLGTSPYIQARWYAAIHGVNPSELVKVQPNEPLKEGALVISTEGLCLPDTVISQVDPYAVFIAPPAAPPRTPLNDNGFKAEIVTPHDIVRFSRGQPIQMNVHVKNVSEQIWRRCSRGPARLQLYLGSHWLDAKGKWLKEEGRSPLPKDLAPGESITMKFRLEPPIRSGNYTIELDMLQEDVTWFGLKGSPTKKVLVVVE